MHGCRHLWKPEVSDSLELELQEFGSHPIWVLGIKLGFSAGTLIFWAILLSLKSRSLSVFSRSFHCMRSLQCPFVSPSFTPWEGAAIIHLFDICLVPKQCNWYLGLKVDKIFFFSLSITITHRRQKTKSFTLFGKSTLKKNIIESHKHYKMSCVGHERVYITIYFHQKKLYS